MNVDEMEAVGAKFIIFTKIRIIQILINIPVLYAHESERDPSVRLL